MPRRRWSIAAAALLVLLITAIAVQRAHRRPARAVLAPPSALPAIAGTIRGVDQGPIADAAIVALAIAGDADPRPIGAARSDAHGEYTLALPVLDPATLVLIQVRHPAFAIAGRRIGPNSTRVDFVLDPVGVAVTVEVRDDRAGPVPGAVVTLAVEPIDGDPDALVWLDAAADAAGQARFPAIARTAATLHWTATAPGRGRALGQHARATDARPVHIVATLQPGIAVTGQVRDDLDQPVPALALTLIELDGPWHATIVTDDRGGFALTDVPPGIAARAEVGADYVARGGYDQAALTMPTAAPAAPVTLIVEPAAAIVGVVTDHGGAPIADTMIAAQPTDGRYGTPRNARTDGDGRFQIDRLRAGTTWTITARHPDFAPAFVEPVAAGDDALAIALVTGGALLGTVTDDDGRALTDVEIYVHRIGRTGDATVGLHEFATARTDDDGQWTLAHLSPGEFRIEVRPAGRMQYAPVAAIVRTATVVEGEQQTLPPIAVTRPGQVQAKVDDVALAGAAARVALLPMGEVGVPHQLDVQLGTDGALVLPEIAPGDYHLALYVPSHGYVAVDDVAVSAGARTTTTLRYGPRLTVTGVVRAARGEFVPGAQVEAFRVDGGSQARYPLPTRAPDNLTGNVALAAADGGYRLTGLAPGRYRIRAIDPGHRAAPTTLEVDVAADATLPITLTAPAALDIVVRDATGAPAADVAVIVEADGGRAWSSTTRTATDGTARVDGLPAHTYRVTAAIAGQPQAAIAIAAGAHRTVELRAPTTGGVP